MMKPTTSYFYDFIPVQYKATDEERRELLNHFPSPQLPNSDDFFDIQSASPGDYIKARLLLNEFQIALTKTNKQFLKNKTLAIILEQLNAKMWDNQGSVERNTSIY